MQPNPRSIFKFYLHFVFCCLWFFIMSLFKTLKKLSSIYHKTLTKHPLLSQSVQVGTLLGIGDITAQLLVKDQKYDIKRTAKFSAIGLFYVGPAIYGWYQILHRFVKGNSKSIVVIKKVILDQVVFSPMSMAAFLIIIGITQRQDMEEMRNTIKKQYFEIMKANYIIWPCIQFVNFYFIPPKFQIVFNQGFACIWNAYLSYKTH